MFLLRNKKIIFDLSSIPPLIRSSVDKVRDHIYHNIKIDTAIANHTNVSDI